MAEKMNRLQIFQVFPNIPEPLSFLEVLSRNLWWSWQVDATELFRRIDPRIWDDCGRNPIVFLARIPQSRLEALARDNGFLSDQERIKERFIELVCTPAEQSYPLYGQQGGVAYFSMEFGVHECLPLFAGGLGILAGDHLKAASDLAIPLTGVGLFYWKGYFHHVLLFTCWIQICGRIRLKSGRLLPDCMRVIPKYVFHRNCFWGLAECVLLPLWRLHLRYAI